MHELYLIFIRLPLNVLAHILHMRSPWWRVSDEAWYRHLHCGTILKEDMEVTMYAAFPNGLSLCCPSENHIQDIISQWHHAQENRDLILLTEKANAVHAPEIRKKGSDF